MLDREAALDEQAPSTVPGHVDAFVSYTRRDPDDVAFADALVEWLTEHGKNTWLDRSSIEPAADWRERIARGIGAATALIFVVTPDSAGSAECMNEIDQAAEQHKRIIPVVIRAVSPADLPEALTRPNWISCLTPDDREHAFGQILAALDQDLEWRDRHARLATRAREWRLAHDDKSRLLRGGDLRDAEAWYGDKSRHEEQPTDEQYEYITASRHAATRRQRVVLGAVSAALVTSLALAVFAFIQRSHAQDESYRAQTGEIVAEAKNTLASDAPLGMLGAVAAARRDHTDASARSVLGTAVREPIRQMIDVKDRGHGAVVAFAPGGSTVAIGDGGGEVSLWDAPTGHRIATLPAPAQGNLDPPISGRVTALAFSPDGRTLVASFESNLGVWDVTTRKGRRILAGQTSSIAFSPDGSLFAAATPGTESVYGVQLWDATTLEEKFPVLHVGKYGATLLAFNNNGSEIAAADDQTSTVHLIDVQSGKQVQTINTATFVAALSFDAFGDMAVGETGGGIEAFATNFDTHLVGATPKYSTLSRNGPVAALGTTREGIVAIGHFNGDVEVWEPVRGYEATAVDMGSPIESISYNDDGTLLASADYNGRVAIIDASSLLARDAVVAVAYSPDGALVAATSGIDGVTIRDARTRRVQKVVAAAPLSVVFVDPQTIAISDALDGVELANVVTGKRQAILRDKSDGAPGGLVLSRDGKQLAVAYENGAVRVWDLATRKMQSGAIGADSAQEPLIALDPADGTLLVGNVDGRVARYPLSGTPSQIVFTNTDGVHALAAAPDGRIMAIGGTSGVTLWDTVQHRVAATLPTGPAARAVAFADAGHTLVIGTTSGRVVVWDLVHNVQLAAVDDAAQVMSLAVSPDGTTLTTGDEYGNATISPVFWHDDVTSATNTLCAEVSGMSVTRDEWKVAFPGSPFTNLCR